MHRKRTWKAHNIFALISILCMVVTFTMCYAGGTFVAEIIPRIWILGLGGVGSIVGTFLYWAGRGASKDAVRSSLIYLGVLSFATSVFWFTIDFIIILPVALSSMSSRPSQLAHDVASILNGTIWLPLQISGWLQPLALPEPFKLASVLLYGFVITAGGLFLLSILTTGLFSKHKT